MGWDSLPFWSLSLNFEADFTPFAFVSLNSKHALHRGDGRSKRGRCWYSQKGLCLQVCRPWAVAPYAAAVNSYSCAQVRIRALPPSPQVCSVDTRYLLEKTLTAAGLDPKLILAKRPLEKYKWLALPKLQRCLGGVSLSVEVSPSTVGTGPPAKPERPRHRLQLLPLLLSGTHGALSGDLVWP